MSEQSRTGSKIVRGRGLARHSYLLIEEMYSLIEAAQPITGRGVGYKLFVAKLIPSMSTGDMAKVYRLLTIARERNMIPWEWIVDETREIERIPSWADPDAFIRTVARSYRRDYWKQQPHHVLVVSEKSTVAGVLRPTLERYGVGFLPVHGFNSATKTKDIARARDGRPLIVLYVGDYDPSGMYMSERDLPERIAAYGGHHVTLVRIALLPEQLTGLPSFPASDK